MFQKNKLSYIHSYIHTYTHTYIHTYVRTYVRTYIHIYKKQTIFKTVFKNDKSLKMLLCQIKCLILTIKVELYNKRVINYTVNLLWIFISLLMECLVSVECYFYLTDDTSFL